MSHVALSPPCLVFAIEKLANVAAQPPMLQVLGIPCGFCTAVVSMRLMNHGEEFVCSEAVGVVVVSFIPRMF